MTNNNNNNNNYTANTPTDEINQFPSVQSCKNVLTNSRLNNNPPIIHLNTSKQNCQQPTTTKSSSIGLISTKSKVTKTSKSSSNRMQNQLHKCLSNSSISRNDQQQMMLNSSDNSYFNGLNKFENHLSGNYPMFEGTTTGSTTNEYQSFADNGHHYNYTNYFNSLNGYNYTNYTTPYSYLNHNQQLGTNQNSFNESSFNSSTTWFEDPNQPSSKLVPTAAAAAYSLINYANSSSQSGYKYNDLLNGQNTTTAANTSVDNFDKTSTASYYIDEYQQNSNNLYDYSKYNQNSLVSRSSASSASTTVTALSTDNSQNSNFNLKKDFLLNPTTSPSSSSTSSCSSSTSPSMLIPSKTSAMSLNVVQDHNNNTNSLFLANSDFKKYENFQNELKVQSNDRLHSFSTSSSCSSNSSLSSNYCDETAVKSYIK
jgi:hypothetical protein